ncbi:MAG: DUF4126 domain-containing protein [Burkholderiaceae bacterium]
MNSLDPAQIVALAAALGWASGIRLYLVLFIVGAVDRAGWIAMPEGLHVLSHPLVLAASGMMVLVEFFADKIPWVDSIWDTVHTFIRVPAGALLAASAVGALDAHGGAVGTLVAAILGGSLAAGAHLTKSSARALANTSPEPFSNIGLSLGEDLLVPGGLFLAFLHPLLFFLLLVAVIAMAAWLVPKIWRFIRRVVGHTPQVAPQSLR